MSATATTQEAITASEFREKLAEVRSNVEDMARLVASAAPVGDEETGAWDAGGQVDQSTQLLGETVLLLRELADAFAGQRVNAAPSETVTP